MARFPNLKPVSRSYTLGQYPISVEETFAGGPIRFKHGTTNFNHELTLNFEALTPEQAALLRTHYHIQQGGYLSFELSPSAWAGHTSMTDIFPSTVQWRYASPPEEEHLPNNYINVSVTLVTSIET